MRYILTIFLVLLSYFSIGQGMVTYTPSYYVKPPYFMEVDVYDVAMADISVLMAMDQTGFATILWGDGTSDVILNNVAKTHTYAGVGHYHAGLVINYNEYFHITIESEAGGVINLDNMNFYDLVVKSMNPNLSQGITNISGINGPWYPGSGPIIIWSPLDSLSVQNITLDPADFDFRCGTQAGPYTTTKINLVNDTLLGANINCDSLITANVQDCHFTRFSFTGVYETNPWIPEGTREYFGYGVGDFSLTALTVPPETSSISILEDGSSWHKSVLTEMDLSGNTSIDTLIISIDSSGINTITSAMMNSGVKYLQIDSYLNLDTVSLSNMVDLEYLMLGGSEFTYMSLSNCPALTAFYFSNHSVLKKVILENCISLYTIDFEGDPIEYLERSGGFYDDTFNSIGWADTLVITDVKANIFYVGIGDYPTLDLSMSGDTAISEFYIANVSEETLDLSGVEIAGAAYISNCPLTTALDFSGQPASFIRIESTDALTTVDLSNDSLLATIDVTGCPLTSLDITGTKSIDVLTSTDSDLTTASIDAILTILTAQVIHPTDITLTTASGLNPPSAGVLTAFTTAHPLCTITVDP